jgi:type VII secretion integral membrane protein EccD
VTSSVNGGLTRVTIAAPRARIDLALPADVALADVVPTLLRYVGADLADEGAGQGGWALSRLGGQVLDNGRTPAQLEVRDGEILYLTPHDQVAPEVVFDDVVDAVATATRIRPGRWSLAATRWFATLFGALALLGGVLVVLFAGPPQLRSGLIGLSLGLALAVTAMLLSRVGGQGRTGLVFAAIGLCYAGAAGLLLLGGDRPLREFGAPHVLIAATTIVVYAAACILALGTGAPAFLGTAAGGMVLGLGAGISLVFGAAPAAAAAALAAIVFAVIPALPMLSYRMARLPVPSVPSRPEELKVDNQTVNGPGVLAGSDRANGFLTAFVTTIAVVETGLAIVYGLAGLAGGILCAVMALLLMMRARTLPGRAQRIPLLSAGTVGLGLVAVGSVVAASPMMRLTAVLGGLVVAALVAFAYGLVVAGRRIPPTWGRLLDIVEVTLIISLVPLAAWVCGLYGWIRSIKS